MKVLVLLACVALVAARPEPPVGGYSHNQGGHYHHGGGHGGHGGYSYQQPAAAPVPLHSGSVGQFSGSAAVATASAGASYDTQVLGGGGLSSFSGAVADAGAQSFGGAVQSNVQAESFGAPQQQIVQKHIYVHVPPPEQPQTFHQTISAPALRQKHYKIIFIKTPSVESQAAQLALQQSQTEEKTIVYVLVKKPEPLADIALPAAAVSKPSKPEVYFIKYKTNSEAVGGAASAAGASAAGLGLLSSSGSASASHSRAPLITEGLLLVSPFPQTFSIYNSSLSLSVDSPAQTYGAPGGHGGYH
ncbi:uncharacterized protein LOC131213442 [Anopheles bellator]|uniref:uncharacterized protein LOC131213442 n=1 Tax=Anopheles bellator TaxID=139047 RepID=UPI002648591E|nr:uncharacterized protein LOC131213442 [Anopheles bellator]